MTGRSNADGLDAVSVDLSEQFRVFDALPVAVRRALANAWFNWDADGAAQIFGRSERRISEAARIVADFDAHRAESLADMPPRDDHDLLPGRGR